MAIPANRHQGSIVITVYDASNTSVPVDPSKYTAEVIVTRGRQGIAALTYPEAYKRALFLVDDGGDVNAPTDTLVYLINAHVAVVVGYFEYFDSDAVSIFTDAVNVRPGCTAVRSVKAAVSV